MRNFLQFSEACDHADAIENKTARDLVRTALRSAESVFLSGNRPKKDFDMLFLARIMEHIASNPAHLKAVVEGRCEDWPAAGEFLFDGRGDEDVE